MAAAQRKRWKALKAQQHASAKKTKPVTAPVKRQKATITTAKKKRTAPAKAAVEAPASPVEVAVEPAPPTE
jgi:hypothetical protein